MKREKLLEVLRVTTDREETKQLLNNHKRKLGLSGVLLTSSNITKNKVRAIRWCEKQLNNRCSFEETRLYRYC